MKTNHIKSLLWLAGAAALVSMSGCGSSSSTTSNDLQEGDGTITLPPSNTGKVFHTSFIENHTGSENLAFYIASAEDTTVKITFYEDNSSIEENITANVSKEITIPNGMMQAGTGTSNKMIEISAEKNIIVVGLNQKAYTTDASLILPDQVLSNEYYTAGYRDQAGSNDEFSVVAIEDGTIVNVTLPDTSELNITLDKGQSYQYQAATELTGSHITSNKNIAVMSGNECTVIPNGYSACDHIEEQMPPVNTWEKTFITVPLATRLNGDTFRFVAAVDGTTIQKDGVVISTLNAGEYHETIIEGSSYIEANHPIMALQYSHGTTWDNVTSDPFMTLVPAIAQFDTTHVINTPNGFTGHYINIVVPTPNTGDIMMDGIAIDSSEFTVVTGNPDYSTAQLAITQGSHVLTSTVAFGLVGYGFANADSYGYPSSLKLIAH